jgi:hypothetical protein
MWQSDGWGQTRIGILTPHADVGPESGSSRVTGLDTMNTENHEAISAIIERQFGSLNWSSTTSASWSTFLEDFLPGASLYAAARPVSPRSLKIS